MTEHDTPTRPEPNRSEPWTGDVPSRDEVLRKLHEGSADLLYLSAFCRNNAGGAAILLQHLVGQLKPREGNGE